MSAANKRIDEVWGLIDGNLAIFEFEADDYRFRIYADGSVGCLGRDFKRGIVINRIAPTLQYLLGGRTPATMKAGAILDEVFAERPAATLMWSPMEEDRVHVHRLLDQLIALGAKVQR